MIRKFFKALWEVMKKPWAIALLVALFAVLCVWLLGPHVAIMDKVLLGGVVARLVATIILVFCWGVFCLLYYGRKKKIEMADPDKADKHEKESLHKIRYREEFDHIKERLQNAIKVVTTSNFYGSKSRSKYTLPWYLVIGTKDCGKTSVLLNSGLSFPINEQADRHLYDLKATERCEVLFSNEAVFIDTPGGYADTQPNSFAHQIWMQLLRRLFKVRPARPVNGVIVCLSMRDIIDSDSARREHLARCMRARLSDVLKHLRAHVPVYLIFTKCDTVPGFSQYFSHLTRNEREQIFGSLARGDAMQPGAIRGEMQDLMKTLNAQIITKIHQERDTNARGDMFRFPQEVSSLGGRIEDFITEAFGPSRYHRPVMFRGFFFTCALSTNDVFSSSLANGEWNLQSGFKPQMGGDFAKGFFLLDLLQRCVIPEARLAGEDKEQKWILRFRRYGVQLAAGVLFLLAGGILGVSFVNNYTNLEKLDVAYAAFASEQDKAPAVHDAKETLPELGKIEQATQIYSPDDDSFMRFGLGLYQGNTFGRATHQAYLGTLNSRFMPAVRTAAAAKIDASLNDVGELKPALRAYLMLCQPKNLNKKFIDGWLGKLWSGQYHGQAATQQEMHKHMEYLVANGIVPVEPDAAVVDRARKALLKIPLAELAYQQMKEEAMESGKAPFTFRSAIGESPFDGDTYAIPALYTRPGYDEYLIARCPGIIRGLTDDSWVFGSNPIALSALDVNKVHKDVRAMYFRDYIQHWSKAVQALKVRTPGSLVDAQKLTEQMTGGISPTVLVLREVKNNTTFVLEQTEPSAVEGAVSQQVQRRAAQGLSRKTGGAVAKAIVGQAAGSLEELRESAMKEALRDAQAVRQYFLPIVNLLDAEGNAQPTLKTADEAMARTRDYFTKLATSDNVEQRVLTALLEIAEDKDDTLRVLERSAEKLPMPVRSWYATASSGGLRRMLALGASSINRAYQERVISVYNKNLMSSYPFDQASDRDVNLDDFGAFFRAGGTLDSFHDAYLRPFVTKSGQLRSIMGRTLPISSQAVVQLQRANRVQDAFFMSGRDLGINFMMEPHALDASLKDVTLSNDGKTLKYWHGPVNGASFAWPLDSAQGAPAVFETTDLNGVTMRRTARGEWALFRLFKGATIKRQEGSTCLIEVQQNGRWAQFLIQFRNKVNPFDPSVCSFTLPEALF